MKYLAIIILLFQISFSKDPELQNRIIFDETNIEYPYDPYRAAGEWDGRYKRLYTLMHETIYEPVKSQITISPNFVYDQSHQSKDMTWLTQEQLDDIYDPEDHIQSEFIITMPSSIQQGNHWHFSDGSSIDPQDIKFSIQYAICTGVIK